LVNNRSKKSSSRFTDQRGGEGEREDEKVGGKSDAINDWISVSVSVAAGESVDTDDDDDAAADAVAAAAAAVVVVVLVVEDDDDDDDDVAVGADFVEEREDILSLCLSMN